MGLVRVLGQSKIVVRTKATGMLARLAHDLEIVSTEVTGTGTVEGGKWAAEVVVPVRSLKVVGALKGGRVDLGVLSDGEKGEIERKIQGEVFEGVREVVGHAEGRTRGEGEVLLTVGGKGRRFRLTQEVKGGEEGGSVVGRIEVSLRGLGLPDVKGPLNAFRVGDTVEVVYHLMVGPG